MDADELISRVARWSKRDDRVLAMGICGSHARGEARPDSDIDFCILTADPGSLLNDRTWIREFGADAEVAGAVEDYNLVQSLRVFYGTTEAEFGVTNVAWTELPIDHETAAVMNNGLRILYDPEGRLERALAFAATISR
ncbi:MAG: nucleotidyltransferase domain-containing protein [Woeseiaceae bacterium]|nr:nucleotidyltransferase domain-containing protein [Woeseiaceae bacterium]